MQIISHSARLTAFLLIFISLGPGMARSSYELSYNCEENICVQGENATFSIRLFQPNISVRYNSVQLIVVETNQTLAEARELDLLVVPGQDKSLTLTGALPYATKKTSRVVPCFTYHAATDAGENVGNVFETCGKDAISITIFAPANKACESDLECPANAQCLAGNCEILDCSAEEAIIDRKCVRLECNDDEQASSNACRKLECSQGTVARNHKCEKISCGFFRKEREGACTFNSWLLFKIIFSLAVLFGIGGFLYRKYKQQHPF